MNKILLEICADSPASAVAAQAGGADRVELCAALDLGGLTPSYAAIKEAVARLAIPVRVLIRPRAGDFCYSPQELDVMCEDIRTARLLGAAGIVAGALDAEGNVDAEAVRRMIGAAGGCPFTFHRAFDLCRDPFGALGQLEGLGVDTVLTSGQAVTAEEGLPLLEELARAATRITVMAGCGLNSGNIARVALTATLGAVHLSARAIVHSPVRYRMSGVYMGMPGADSQYDYTQTDEAHVKACRRALDEITR